MAKLLKQVHDQIKIATDKGITEYHAPAEIDNVIDNGQMGFFRELVKEFAKTKIVRNELLPFQRRANVTIASNVGSLPTDFEHEMDVWANVGGVDYEVRLFEAGMFRRRLRDPIDIPSTTNLMANIYFDTAKKIEVSNQITPVVMNYFKRPIKPFYATTLSGAQLIYDDTNTIDMEWSQICHDIIVERSLLLLGLNMKDGQIQRAGQNMQPKEISAL
jgi:hypothetical protein